MHGLPKFLHPILKIGVKANTDEFEQRQLMNFNSLLLFGAMALFLSLSTNLISQTWTTYDNIIYLGGYSIIAICLFLNKIGKFKAATIITHLGISALFCLGGLHTGTIFLCCMINLVWMVISFRFWQNSRETIIYSLIQLAFVIGTIFFVSSQDYGYNTQGFNPIVRSIVFALLFMFLFTMTKLFTDQIRSYFNKVNELVVELEKKNQKIEMAYNDMEQFGHRISHDLKAPLRNMNTYAVLLKKDAAKNKTDNLENYTSEIYNNGIKLTKMIDDVLAYSKLNASETEQRELVELDELIKPIRDNMSRIYPNSIIKLPCHGQLIGSKTKLTMLMQNLIENGIKYNKNEKQEIDVSYQRQNGHYIITVEDNGIGISEDYHDQIFNLFSRLHSDSEYEGTGIGLSTCKKIVEEHLNGELSVSSKVDQGSTFTIKIPVKH